MALYAAAAAGRGTTAPLAGHRPGVVRRPGRPHVLAVCGGSARELALTAPAIRALAAGAERVTLLCGPRGRTVGSRLPVDDVVDWPAPWLDPPAESAGRGVAALVCWLATVAPDEAVIFTSFHQSALPYALLLRMAGVPRVTAISDDYPGSLLDVRHRVPYGAAQTERALSVAAAAGYPPPAGGRRTPDAAGWPDRPVLAVAG